jgi:hypothetical protein
VKTAVGPSFSSGVTPDLKVGPTALWVCLVSGAIGFRVGAVGYADWQDVVEPAQVVAGLVAYPHSTPFFIYQTKLWTILHQVLAVLLRAGVSEITLSTAVSGLLGAVSFQALSMFVYAFARSPLLAIGAPLIIFFTRAAEFGVVYPIWLLGTSYTYGVIGLSVIVLAAALVGAGALRIGSFVLGVAPAIHPSLGMWLWLIAALCVLWDFRHLRQELGPALRFFFVGAAVTAASLTVQLTVISQYSQYGGPAIDAATAEKYLAGFVSFWDGHRQPVRLRSDGLALNIAALVVGLFWLTKFATDVPRSSLFLLRFIVVSAGLSLVVSAMSWIPPDRLPPSLLIVMPARVLNVNAMTFAALLLGILGAYRNALWSRALTVGLIVGLIVGNRSLFSGAIQSINSAVVMLVATIVAIVAAALSRRHLALSPSTRRFTGMASQILRIAAVLALGWAGIQTWRSSRPGAFALHDRTNDFVFQSISRGKGLLLTGGDLHMIQLRTRRPVLLDGGGLDGLPYAIEAAPEMERILRDAYSIDLLNPPDEARYRGSIPNQFNRNAWEMYSLERWQLIAREYGVTQVLTPEYWNLKLPVAAQNRTVTVYDIPHASP